MNKISPEVKTGTIGELLVQLRLLQYGVQAAPPIKDSGNDLIAIRQEVFRSIQVKTTTGDTYSKANLPDLYHILAVVHLVGDGYQVFLDRSRIFLIPQENVSELPTSIDRLARFLLTRDHLNNLFLDAS
jgi:hypothetical protein